MLLNAWKIIEDGDTSRILLAIEDITERQQFETERSQLLTQEQSARQEAETANRAKDVFLSNLSHELRNPLNIMLGWLHIIRTRKLDKPATARAIETIERSAKTQAKLIEDILDVSRIISGKLELRTRLLDLAPVIGAAIASVQPAAEAKTIQISSHLPTLSVLGDPDRLQQVLWNLLSNAIKFTPAGGQVEITLESVNQQAQIRVSDTGQGIPADLLPWIFDRFRQGDSSTTKASQGLGLGLAIVRQLVELHGGTIEAESAGKGQGTTMTVKFPLRSPSLEDTLPTHLEPATEELDTEDSSNVWINAPIAKTPSLAGFSILVVDDEENCRVLMKCMLEEFGAEVLVVASVSEAIAALTENPGQYDVLLSDIGMPEEDGYSLIRQIRAFSAEAGGQIPAVAITAYVSDQERQMAIEAGFQAHIAKPVDIDPLIVIIANLGKES
jgi:two-component system, chemotaxis family, CheB/CheR fusion protein